MKVLVVKMSSLGDVIHTLPALTDAAGVLPGVGFDWVVEEAFAEVPGWHPAVDRVIPVALRRWRRHPLRDFRGPEWRAARRALRERRYDAVIDAQGLLKSAFIARLVDAPRHGMDFTSAREALSAVAYHRRVRVPRDMHAIERVRLLFARSLDYTPPRTTCDYGVAFDGAVAGGDIWFLHGTARAEKCWPESHWQALGRECAARGLAVCLPRGTEEEAARAARIADAVAAAGGTARVLPASGLTDLAREFAGAAAAVAVDTGLGHLAAALGVPAVSLYGPTRPERVGALGPGQRHLCATHGTAMAAIDPADVGAALFELAADRRAALAG